MRQTDFVVTLFEGGDNPNYLTVGVVMGLNAPDVVTLLMNAKASLQLT